MSRSREGVHSRRSELGRPRTRRRRWLLVLSLLGPVAQAREVWTDGRGASLDLQGFYKSVLTAARVQPGLVESAEVWDGLVDAARARLPADQAALLPATSPLPSAGLVNLHLLRAAAGFRFEHRFSFDVAWQLGASLASSSTFTQGSPLTSSVGAAATTRVAQRRWVELTSTLVDDLTLRVEQSVDRLAVKLALPFGDLTVGRQALSWGTGRLWNPTDVLSPFPPTAVDREVRRGFDAVRLAVALGPVTQLDVLFLPQRQAVDAGAVARLQANIAGWDGSISVGKYVHDVVLGADAIGDVGPLGLHAEAAYTLGLVGLGEAGAPVRVGEHFLRAVAGVDWRPHEKVLLMAEYHYNGYGAGRPSDYVATLSSSRVTRGEIFGAGRHAAAIVATYQSSELLSASATLIGNLADPSGLLIPALEYWFEQNVIVRLGGSVPLGAGPDARVFSALTADDVLTGTAALNAARRSLGLRSEHGAAPWSAFLQVGLYVP